VYERLQFHCLETQSLTTIGRGGELGEKDGRGEMGMEEERNEVCTIS